MKKGFLIIIVLSLSFNTFSQKTVKAPVSEVFRALKLTKMDLPQGYNLSTEMNCKSMQAALFYDSYESLYTDLIGKLKSKEFQSVSNEQDNGSILYFEFEKEFTQTGFLEGLLWGGEKPVREHPEEYYANGNILIIWSTSNISLIKERSKKKIGSDVVIVSQALLAAKKKGTDKELIQYLGSYLSGTKPIIPSGNIVSVGNAYKYNLTSRVIIDNGFYALMLQNSNGILKADAFNPSPSNEGEITSTKGFINGLKNGKLKTDNEIYQYINGLFGTRDLFAVETVNNTISFGFKEDKKENQIFLRQKGNILYMVNVEKNIFTEGFEFAYYYFLTK
jgi:hypothetical protein